MSIFTALVLGAIQGITEFLPVSSSGHLVLFQKIFDISEPALFFDTMVHVGTLAAVFVVLRRDIWAILRRLIQPLTAYLIVATVPTVLVALVFKDAIEGAFESGRFLGFAFLITAALLSVSELLARRSGNTRKKAGDMPEPQQTGTRDCSSLDALVIGGLQAVAIIPGVSRSGATLSGALSRRLNRDFAARFSFLLSIPAILGALVFQLKDLAKDGGTGMALNGGIGPGAIVAGAVSAAVVGFFAVRFMLKIVREKSLWGFAVYTAVLGTLVLIDQFGAHLVFKNGL
jgi:undecaprenyl-diphosphatase